MPLFSPRAAPPGADAPLHPRLDADTVDALLAIDADLAAPGAEWAEFVGEAVSHWLVEQRAPAGDLDVAKTRWLLRRIDRGGQVQSRAALLLLQRCVVRARRVSGELMAYLRRQEEDLRLPLAA
ncbi:MAG TPA: hypothetical protein VFF98_17940 [Novosphingobium sp.]|nr:hypothetical protein [Novosphingobium sp.]HZV11366.1 hypothetical protein [Novosphingobium sp.]